MGIAKRILILSGVAALVLTACSPRLRVKPLTEGRAQRAGQDVYYLPQTVLEVRFTLSRKIYTPGPYAAFAESLLGIEGADKLEAGTYWAIDSIAIMPLQEPDLGAAFLIEAGNQAAQAAWLTLTNAGFLMPAGAAPAAGASSEGFAQPGHGPAFTDLSTQQFVADKTSIFYSTVQQDTAFIRVPVQRNVVVKESLEEKAKQAADLIFSLRKQRIGLIGGDAEIPAAQGVLRDMLSELDKIEARYLSLFIGRWEHSKQTVRLSYLPTLKEESSMLCRFSGHSGICPTSELTATPVLISVKPLGEGQAPKENKMRTLTNGMYYRPGRTAEVSVTLLRDRLISTRIPISQFGRIVPIYSVPAK